MKNLNFFNNKNDVLSFHLIKSFMKVDFNKKTSFHTSFFLKFVQKLYEVWYLLANPQDWLLNPCDPKIMQPKHLVFTRSTTRGVAHFPRSLVSCSPMCPTKNSSHLADFPAFRGAFYFLFTQFWTLKSLSLKACLKTTRKIFG